VLGKIRIADDEGTLLPVNAVGNVYFADGPTFEYHNDPEKTRSSYNKHGWATMGDIGHVDADGYLFLTDRKHFMIISGGVNICPQEIENLIVTHPRVLDVAVFDVPDEEMGEKVVAVVQPARWEDRSEDLVDELRTLRPQCAWRRQMPQAVRFSRSASTRAHRQAHEARSARRISTRQSARLAHRGIGRLESHRSL
jgi:long-chain acyl-CoA synthetase